MLHEHDGLTYDTATSTELYARGQGDAAYARDGYYWIGRTPNGRLWMLLAYWPSAYGPQERQVFFGEAQVRAALNRYGRADIIKALNLPMVLA